MRGGRRLLVPGLAAVAVLCCAVPALITFVAGLGFGAWLGAHGSWRLGLVAIAIAIATAAAVLRRRLPRCDR